MMRLNPLAKLPSLEVIQRSLDGMRYERRYLIVSLHHNREFILNQYAKGAVVAKKILKLERIIKEMELIEMAAKINELAKAA